MMKLPHVLKHLVIGYLCFLNNPWGFVQSDVRINEIHYINSSGDSGEFVEIAHDAADSIENYQVVLYKGATGVPYENTKITESSPTGFTVISYESNSVRNGPDGIALVHSNGTLIEFLSYGGTFRAQEGPAKGVLSKNIGVVQNSKTVFGRSLQRCNNPGFKWTGPIRNTFQRANGACKSKGMPTFAPTLAPSKNPTSKPSSPPTSLPTSVPSWLPSSRPSSIPTRKPGRKPRSKQKKKAVSAPVLQQSTIRINCGSTTAYVDAFGNSWLADVHFNGGITKFVNVGIGGTFIEPIYQDSRLLRVDDDLKGYVIPVTPGIYTVRLHFAEIYDAIVEGERVFDVFVQNNVIRNDFDIYIVAGGLYTAIALETIVVVHSSDPNVNVTFGRDAGDPAISGIEVLPGTSSIAFETVDTGNR